jgi:DNA-binding response OmpR family regulator
MGNHSVLVVDTEKSVVDRVKSALSADGYKVQAAGSSQEAIDVAKREKPQLLIINPIMPARSGVVIAKETSQAVGAKVLFLTELARDPDFREVLRGLRQQGCECTALGREVEARELLRHVRREI